MEVAIGLASSSPAREHETRYSILLATARATVAVVPVSRRLLHQSSLVWEWHHEPVVIRGGVLGLITSLTTSGWIFDRSNVRSLSLLLCLSLSLLVSCSSLLANSLLLVTTPRERTPFATVDIGIPELTSVPHTACGAPCRIDHRTPSSTVVGASLPLDRILRDPSSISCHSQDVRGRDGTSRAGTGALAPQAFG